MNRKVGKNRWAQIELSGGMLISTLRQRKI